MIKNQWGQALMETLFSLPIVLSAMMIILIYIYSWTSQFLIDHWVYQSALCLSEDKSLRSCRTELEEKLGHIPYLTYQIKKMSKTSSEVRLQVKTLQPLNLQMVFEEKLRLPLVAEDFRVYQ